MNQVVVPFQQYAEYAFYFKEDQSIRSWSSYFTVFELVGHALVLEWRNNSRDIPASLSSFWLSVKTVEEMFIYPFEAINQKKKN